MKIGTTVVGGFKIILFSPLPGEMIQFDEHIFLKIGLKPPTSGCVFWGKVWQEETISKQYL